MDELARLFPTHPHLLWLIAALALAFAELLTGGFVLLWFACGALAAGLASFLGAGLNAQLLVLGVVSLLLFAGSRTIFRELLMAGGTRVATNAAAMIGSRAEVVAEVGARLAGGTVKVNGEVWNAHSEGEVLPAGTPVVIERIDGLSLLVRAAS